MRDSEAFGRPPSASGGAPEGGGKEPRSGAGWHHGLVLLFLSLGVWLGLEQGLVAAVHGYGAVHLALAVAAAGLSAVAFFRHLRWWLDGVWQDRSWAPFRLFFYGLVGQWLFSLLFFEALDARRLGLLWAVVLAVVAGLLLLGKGSGRRWGRLGAGLDLALFYFCALLVAGELGARLLASRSPSVLLARAGDAPAARIAATQPPAGQPRMGFPINRLGFYDVEPEAIDPEQPLVVAIGDSFSMGVVPQPRHFTSMAEELLPGDVEVFNVGVAGIEPPEYLHLVRTEALPLAPDAIVVGIFLGNDLDFPVVPAEERWLRAWYDRDNILIYQLARRLLRLAGSETRPEGGAPGRPGPSPNALLASSDLDPGSDLPWLDDPSLEPPSFTRSDFLRIERERAEFLHRLTPEQAEPRFEVLRRMVEAAGDIPLIFLLIPDEFQVEDDLWQEVQEASPLTLRRHRGYDLLVDWLRRNDLLYVDMLRRLQSVPALASGRRHLYHRRDTHWNARGNRAAGEALAEALRPLVVGGEAGRQFLPIPAGSSDGGLTHDLQLFNPGSTSLRADLELRLLDERSVTVSSVVQPGTVQVFDDIARRTGLEGAGFLSVEAGLPVLAALRSSRRGDAVGMVTVAAALADGPRFVPGIGAAGGHLLVAQSAPGPLISDVLGGAYSDADGRVFQHLPLSGLGSEATVSEMAELTELSASTALAAWVLRRPAGPSTLELMSAAVPQEKGCLWLPAEAHGQAKVRFQAAAGGGEVALTFHPFGEAGAPERLSRTLPAGGSFEIGPGRSPFAVWRSGGLLVFHATNPVLATGILEVDGPGSGGWLSPLPLVSPGQTVHFPFSGAPPGGKMTLAVVNLSEEELIAEVWRPGGDRLTLAVPARAVRRWTQQDLPRGSDETILLARGDRPAAWSLVIDGPEASARQMRVPWLRPGS